MAAVLIDFLNLIQYTTLWRTPFISLQGQITMHITAIHQNEGLTHLAVSAGYKYY